MSWDTINRARKAADRPVGMTYTYCKWPDCKLATLRDKNANSAANSLNAWAVY